jgi:hypothetical protein
VARLEALNQQLREQKQSLEIRVGGLESESGELRAEIKKLRAAAAVPPALTIEQHLVALENLLLKIPLPTRGDVMRPFVNRILNGARRFHPDGELTKKRGRSSGAEAVS